MQAETRRGRATRNAFAKALIKRVQNGESVADIPVRNLAEDCGVDRQTFYYHFKNMSELAEYAYDCEIEKHIDSCLDEGTRQKTWKDRARVVIPAIEGNALLVNSTGPFVNCEILWKNIAHRVEANLLHEFGPELDAYDIDDEAKAASIKQLSIAITSIYISWASHFLECTLEEMLDSAETIRSDYQAGLDARFSRRQD